MRQGPAFIVSPAGFEVEEWISPEFAEAIVPLLNNDRTASRTSFELIITSNDARRAAHSTQGACMVCFWGYIYIYII